MLPLAPIDGVTVYWLIEAEQVPESVPPPEPAQVHDQGPVPVKLLTVPEVQLFAVPEANVSNDEPLLLPHTPLTGPDDIGTAPISVPAAPYPESAAGELLAGVMSAKVNPAGLLNSGSLAVIEWSANPTLLSVCELAGRSGR